MPKLKTHRGAAKRFKITGSGKILRKQAFTSHILEKKSPKRKRHLSHTVEISKSDKKVVRRMLGA